MLKSLRNSLYSFPALAFLTLFGCTSFIKNNFVELFFVAHKQKRYYIVIDFVGVPTNN
jgi:hypothetical protein